MEGMFPLFVNEDRERETEIEHTEWERAIWEGEGDMEGIS